MRKILLILIVLTGSLGVYAQDVAISGKVVAEEGVPLPGVSVLVKGTANGTSTDQNGNYTLMVPSGTGVLTFSFIGYKSLEVDIAGRTTVDVQMTASTTELSEVVVTAFGIAQEKKSLGYAVQEVKGSELLKARETNIVNSLSGKIAGVNVTNSSGAVGASSRIVIRGANSFGNNQPLFVVDGVPISNNNFGGTGNEGTNRGNGAADLNPDDIESLTVLKGPNASALYGSRGANGVILVTTKSGKKGAGLGIQFSSSATFETPLKLPDYQNKYGQGSGGQFSFVDGAGGGINDGTDESWGPRLDAGLMIPQFFSDGAPAPWKSNPDNIKNFFEVGKTLANSVSITGGNEKTSVRLSYTNQQQTGMVPNTDQAKNTVALSGKADLTDKFSINMTANYVKTHSDNLPGYGYSDQNVMQQFIWFGRQVDTRLLKNYQNPDGSQFNWNYNYHNNPYFILNENLNTLDRDRLFGNIRANYQITDWLSVFVRTGTDYYTNTNTGRISASDIGNPFGSYAEASSMFSEINTDFLVTFNKNLTDNIGLTLSAGGNRMDQKNYQITGTAPELAIPGIYTLNNSKVPLQTTSFHSLKRINSLYFSGEVSYLGSLFLNFTGRNDWSSTLPKNENSYFYPSVSVSAVLTDLFDIGSDVLSFAKARVGYGEVGSDTAPYQLLGSVDIAGGWNAATKLPGLTVPNALPNNALKPQSTKSIEVGVELGLFQNRARLDVTYYNASTVDQIINIPISSSSGYTSQVINAGEITNKGIEVALGGTAVKTSNGFTWDVTLNFARNINKVVSLAPGIESFVLGTYWDLQISAIPGEKFGSFVGYGFLRDPKGNVIHANGIPQRDPTAKILGNYTPDWTGGLQNEFSFKGINFSFLIDVKKGGELYTMTTTWGRYAGVLEETLLGRENGIVGDGVIDNGDGTFRKNDVAVTAEAYNKAAFVNSLAEPSIFDASFVKLREIRFGYTLPNKLVQQTPFRDINLSIIGRNLALLYSKAPHIDPETAFSNGNVQGIEFGQLPSARSIGFNLSFKLQ